MRNLVLSAFVSSSFVDGNVSTAALDLDNNALYVVSERQTPDADVEIEIFKLETEEEKGNSFQMSPPLSVAMFNTTSSPSVVSSASQIAALRVLPETHSLSLIMRGGDIAMLSLDEPSSVEVEGSVDAGILAASWSPDDSLLVLVTGDEKLILMTSTFDVLSEAPLHTADFGDDAPINVGWGSKQTQFHGSLGKSAAQAQTSPLASVGTSPDDDALPRITWRGDGALFAVSSLTPPSEVEGTSRARRTVRVYDRQAALQATAEPVAGLEHGLAWRPSGSVIVGTQRFGFEGGGAGREGRHDVVFFERNGLRHGEFALRETDAVGKSIQKKDGKWEYRVREVSWSSDSYVLSVWIERKEGDVVQLWTTGNYHWYLKQEISAPPSPSSPSTPGRFTSVSWHPEKALHLILTTASEVIQRSYAWETFVSRSKPPEDTGCVAVFDGSNVLLTPFRVQNVPPPMSSYQLSVTPSPSLKREVSRTPIHASLSPLDEILALLWESGRVELWALHTRIGIVRGKVMEPVKIWEGEFAVQSRQVVVGKRTSGIYVAALGLSGTGEDVLTVQEIHDEGSAERWEVPMPDANGRLVASAVGLTWQAPDGEIFDVDLTRGAVLPVSRFPEFCFSSEHVSVCNERFFIGLSHPGKLYIANTSTSNVLATNANSFVVASGFVIYTTTAHEAHFALLPKLPDVLAASAEEGTVPEWEKRRVERGSRIVTAVPSAMSLVLQMPRGNLETINPRPLVMEVVKQDLDAGNYRKAFFACRKHRIDLNVIVEHDQAGFISRLASFIEQVDDVDHINLFLTSIGRGSQPPEIIAMLCDAIRMELEKRDLNRYINSILTAYVVKTPPDHEAGLALLLRLRDTHPNLVEDAVKYIIFLVDADRLFDTALGMYDFSLVLMIAQHAQKDPREYLPFLRELRALEKYYQRFRIDDHLRRYEKALQNLSLAGSDHFDEAVTYIERHQLYVHALLMWKGTDRYDSVLGLYGDWLFERREFKQAASVFIEAKKSSKAMIAHEKALEWQELFDLAMREEVPEDEISAMSYRVAEDLSSKKRYSESARVLLDYSKDVREAVIALVQGNHFSEARRLVALHSVPEMLVDIIYPGALESRVQLAEDINEMRDQLRKQLHRLEELRIKKVEEPDSFYGVEDPTLQNIDVMTDVSMPATAFTRYTVAPSTSSRTSKRSSRSKRKMERKVGSGRKGTVDEEEYLLKSLTKLAGRFSATQAEAANLLPHLLQFTSEHRTEGMALQQDLDHLELELKTALEDVWKKPSIIDDQPQPIDSWATRMEEREKARQVNPTEKVAKPEFAGDDWRMKLFDVEKREGQRI